MRAIYQRRPYMLAGVLGVALLAAAGCGRSEEGRVAGVKIGMTVAEADAILGPGEDVAFEQLPAYSRNTIFPKNDGATYRRWTRESGKTKDSYHAAFEGGKLAIAPMHEKTAPMSVNIK